jgi:hypothetical protein
MHRLGAGASGWIRSWAVAICLAFGSADASPIEPQDPSPDLMQALMEWAAPRVELPIPAELPVIVRAGHCELQRMATQTENCPSVIHFAFVGLYQPGFIVLRRDWQADSVRDLSILLHELVHHMQHSAGVEPLPCRAVAWEQPAYSTQMAFLKAEGLDPLPTIGISPLHQRALTSCG